MWQQLFRSVDPSVVVAYLGTTDLQRTCKVVLSVLVVQLAVLEPQIPVECPAHTAYFDFEDQDSNHKEEQLGPLNPLDWQLLRLAILLHCAPIWGKSLRATSLSWHGCGRKLCQTWFGQADFAEATGNTHFTLMAEWPDALARERMLTEQSVVRLRFIQSELASLHTGQFALGDVD